MPVAIHQRELTHARRRVARDGTRYIVSRHPITRLNTATVRLMQTDLMTIRIDLNGEDA